MGASAARVCCVVLGLVACLAGPALAQPVIVTTDAGAEGDAAVTMDDALEALEFLGDGLDVEEADVLLRRAYADRFTPTERARGFLAAAEIASRKGEHLYALAWVDWAVRETQLMTVEAPELSEEVHGAAIGIAVAAGDPLEARRFLRGYAALELGWTDDPASAGVTLEPTGARCPDVIADQYVRMRIERDAPTVGASSARPAHCHYRPFASTEAPKAQAIELYATQVWAPARERLRGVVENGLHPADAAARAAIADRLRVLSTHVGRRVEPGEAGLIGFARYSRPGVDEVEAIGYGLLERDGALFASRVSAQERSWPPESLRSEVNAGLTAMLGDGGNR